MFLYIKFKKNQIFSGFDLTKGSNPIKSSHIGLIFWIQSTYQVLSLLRSL